MARKPLDLWWQGKRAFADLAVPVRECDRCMAVVSDFSSVEQDLRRVVQTKLGGRMFGAALREMQRSKIDVRIQAIVDALDTDEVTEAHVKRQRCLFLDERAALGMDARAEHAKPLVVQVLYRECP